jgi:hypothetical protein
MANTGIDASGLQSFITTLITSYHSDYLVRIPSTHLLPSTDHTPHRPITNKANS